MKQDVTIPEIGNFTKANVFAVLTALGDKLELDEEQAKLFAQTIEPIEPKAGGGASKNPSYKDEETGIMMHYCRFKQCFMPEHMMNLHEGKSKGASTLAALHDYQIIKQVKELRAQALKQFIASEFVEGTETNTKADELDGTRKNPETYNDEVLEQYKKDVPTEATAENTTDEESETAESTEGDI